MKSGGVSQGDTMLLISHNLHEAAKDRGKHAIVRPGKVVTGLEK
jgi:hypothetical protein